MLRYRFFLAFVTVAFCLCNAGKTFASSSEVDEFGGETALQNMKTSAAQVITAAEKESAGKVIQIEIKRENGMLGYQILAVSQGKAIYMFVEDLSGKIEHQKEGASGKRMGKDEIRESSQIATLPTSMAQAIDIAEKQSGGKAIKAEFSEEDGKMLYEVKVFKDKGVHKIMIDGRSGKLIPAKK